MVTEFVHQLAGVVEAQQPHDVVLVDCRNRMKEPLIVFRASNRFRRRIGDLPGPLAW